MMAASPSMQALVVGANESMSATLAILLKRCGYSAFCVDNGEAALAEAPRINPDVIFIDAASRETVGPHFARRLREMSRLSSTPLVAIGDAATETAEGTIAGVDYDDRLSDSFTLADLAALIGRLKRKTAAARDRIALSRSLVARSRKLTDASRGALDEFWLQRIDARLQPVCLLGGDEAILQAVAEGPTGSHPVARFESLEGLHEALATRVNGSGACVVLDVTVWSADTVAAIRQLVNRQPRVSVIVLVADDDVPSAVQCVRAGAFDVIEKSRAPQKLSEAIAASLADTFSAADTINTTVSDLSDGERRLLLLTAQGMLNKQIARELDVCLRTVHIRRAELMKKLGIGNRTELIRLAVEAGLLH
jgi:FixJ family two-component response regulator